MNWANQGTYFHANSKGFSSNLFTSIFIVLFILHFSLHFFTCLFLEGHSVTNFHSNPIGIFAFSLQISSSFLPSASEDVSSVPTVSHPSFALSQHPNVPLTAKLAPIIALWPSPKAPLPHIRPPPPTLPMANSPLSLCLASCRQKGRNPCRLFGSPANAIPLPPYPSFSHILRNSGHQLPPFAFPFPFAFHPPTFLGISDLICWPNFFWSSFFRLSPTFLFQLFASKQMANKFI